MRLVAGGTMAVLVAVTALAVEWPQSPPAGEQTSQTQHDRCRTAAVRAPGPPAAGPLRPLWRGDAEEGSLADWSAPQRDPGGGEFDSGSGHAYASRARARRGTWAAKLMLADGRGGARLFRWRELRAHRHVVVSAWLRIPRRYRPTASPRTGRFWNVFQFKSRSESGANDPLWYLDLARRGKRLRLDLIWWHRTLEGPRHGQSGFRRFRQRTADVPIGRWFRISAELVQSNGFDGMLCVWQDGHLLFARSGIRTSFANCAYNAWCTANEWSVNNYSDGLAPAPSVLYVDDARVAAVGP